MEDRLSSNFWKFIAKFQKMWDIIWSKTFWSLSSIVRDWGLEDQIYYDNINKIKINIIDINNPRKNAEIKIKLNKKIKSNFISSKKINLGISRITLGYTEINYQLLF